METVRGACHPRPSSLDLAPVLRHFGQVVHEDRRFEAERATEEAEDSEIRRRAPSRVEPPCKARIIQVEFPHCRIRLHCRGPLAEGADGHGLHEPQARAQVRQPEQRRGEVPQRDQDAAEEVEKLGRRDHREEEADVATEQGADQHADAGAIDRQADVDEEHVAEGEVGEGQQPRADDVDQRGDNDVQDVEALLRQEVCRHADAGAALAAKWQLLRREQRVARECADHHEERPRGVVGGPDVLPEELGDGLQAAEKAAHDAKECEHGHHPHELRQSKLHTASAEHDHELLAEARGDPVGGLAALA
mmetsp:Transcript_88039/g.269345  ORF Transcript_88039/g.269345 Transcript_88039/m.269345 type:complete len:305 (-) Transcript_88039:1591-2505(-)